jgi:hypothetical protein
MAKELTHAELLAHSRKANAKLDDLNDARSRLAKELNDALLKAYEDGIDLEGVTFELVFVIKAEPVKAVEPEPVTVEVEPVEVEVEDDAEETVEETEDEADAEDDEAAEEVAESEAEKPVAKKAAAKKSKKSKK